ncbi:beta-lactamase family protein [Pseudomonas chlororaphis]|uniref:serine hydrolase domain-containing protein n=1 Tax=Pseudomonas chlororaphis TaxID=587753 RepID=UPI00209AD385|nr:serine hydrolase domain-containing protein [Pseudomonas chlororaphis]MCO7572806.1 beta-lactamase family protein [Pseudomonas chlororaphis]MCO7591122.1 beta-lactamase family protein [Pseudomonas chlororaphis]
MSPKLLHLPLLGVLLGSLGCHGQPPAPPTIGRGDYASIIGYLKQYIPREMAEHRVPGLSIALVDGQELIWARGFGFADQARGLQVTENTAFRAGALSQLLTATAVMQLVEQGRLQLDAPLQDSLREFYVRSRFHQDQNAADQAVTLRRLLSHQAGLPTDYLRDRYTSQPLGELPGKVSGVWLNHCPGTQTAYSNLGYALLGAAIERSSGLDFERQLQKSLLHPLGMSQSSFLGTRLAQPYRARGYADGVGSADEPLRDLSATGLWSSPRDLSRFVRMLFAQGYYKDRQVLSPASIKEMGRAQNTGNPLDFDCQVGLGWYLSPCGEEWVSPGIRTWQHSAVGSDFQARVSVLPEQQLAVIVMSNSGSGEAVAKPLVPKVLRMLLQAHGAPARQKRDSAQPQERVGGRRRVPQAADRQHLAGFYATTWGVLRIRDQDQRLFGELAGKRFELLRDEQGWLRAQKKFLGLWRQDLGDLGQVQLDLMNVQGRRVFTARRHGQLLAMGERVDPVPLPDNWLATVGTYQALNEDSANAAVSDISITLEDGFLMIRSLQQGRAPTDYILAPVDNAHAVIAGQGPGLGDTVRRQINGINILGYSFKRTYTRHYLRF